MLTIQDTAEVKFTKDEQCTATKIWNVNAYSKGYRVMDSNSKVIWGPANPPHCLAAHWIDVDRNVTDLITLFQVNILLIQNLLH
jgi:hypothetical protein